MGSEQSTEVTAQLDSHTSPPLPGRETSLGSQASPTIKACHIELERDMKLQITIILAPFELEKKNHNFLTIAALKIIQFLTEYNNRESK